MSGLSESRSHLLARANRVLAVPVILGWVALTVVLNIVVPQLEAVGKTNSTPLMPKDAPSQIASKRLGEKFQEYSSDSSVIVVLESDVPLGDAAHHYYDGLIQELKRDKQHVQHVSDFWGDSVTAAVAQSEDNKAAYVRVHLTANKSDSLATKSVEAVREAVKKSPPPKGLEVFVTGPAAFAVDGNETGVASMLTMTFVALAVIALMLLLFYRSITTTLIALAVVLLELGMTRGFVASLGSSHLVGVSPFAASLLTALAIATGSDYLIFLFGRYHEARNAGDDRGVAYNTAVRSVTYVVAGSGLTIAGTMLCLSFTRLHSFNSLGMPCALGTLVILAMALTLGPAVLVVAGRFGLLDPVRKPQTRGWRNLGVLVARWPGPALVCAGVAALLGVIALCGYQTNYNDRQYFPTHVPSNVGYAAAERHFSSARLNPDVLLVESDHDLRNAADLIRLDKIAKNVFRVPGISRVQGVTRPLGSRLDQSASSAQVGLGSAAFEQSLQFIQGRLESLGAVTDKFDALEAKLKQLSKTIDDSSHESVGNLSGAVHDVVATIHNLRDDTGYAGDYLRPFRNYFYWETNCYELPWCWTGRSVFDILDQIDRLDIGVSDISREVDKNQELFEHVRAELKIMIEMVEELKTTTKTLGSILSAVFVEVEHGLSSASSAGQAIVDARADDDVFSLPPDALDNPGLKRSMELLMSPDGTAAQFVITHDTDPVGTQGASTVDAELQAAREAVKGTRLANTTFSLAGGAPVAKDIQRISRYDLLILALSSTVLIFAVMVVVTRTLVATLVIVGSVVLSLAASLGLSMFLWQHILGVDVNWVVPPVSVLILLAVGSDYNLLIVLRFREELGSGLRTGLIRTMASTSGVVTVAGLVFASTMMSMVTSDLLSIGQIGTTIGLGILFDIFVVRSLMTPAIAALLGRWFWWPQRIWR